VIAGIESGTSKQTTNRYEVHGMNAKAKARAAEFSGTYMIFAILAMVAAPVPITLQTVRIPAHFSDLNPTQYGYTTSLLLFIIPIIVIACWFLLIEGLKVPQRAFWRTIANLVPFGFALDLFFASRFFVFRNPRRDSQGGFVAVVDEDRTLRWLD
jgi:hypothetical protein